VNSLEKEISGWLAEARKENEVMNARLKKNPNDLELLLRVRSTADTVVRYEKELKEAKRGAASKKRSVGGALSSGAKPRGLRGLRSARPVSKPLPDDVFRYDNDDISLDDAVDHNLGVYVPCNTSILCGKNGL
jgi:hypothetical protein